jgi:hypothetical protein
MKTAKQWVDENSQSGAFDTVGSCADAESLVAEIQRDAMLEVSNALDEYHEALRARQHGGVAQDKFTKRIERFFGRRFDS